jgi:hypothetical protein
MKTRPFMFMFNILLATSVTSCTQGQMEQVLGSKTQDMISGPCPPGEGLLSAAPEFCLYVTELRVTHDTEADVNVTIANRTGRRLYVLMPTRPSLSDSSGTKWEHMTNTGIGSSSGSELPVDSNVNSLITMTFRQRGQLVPPDLAFAMSGEVMIFKADSRGEMIRQVAPIARRGFQFSGIRQQPQAAPLGSSSIPGIVAPSSAAMASSSARTSPSRQQLSQAPVVSPQNSRGLSATLPASSNASPDVLGIKVGVSSIAEVRAALASVAPALSVSEKQEQLQGRSADGRAFSEVVNIENSQYLSVLTAITQSYKDVTQCPSLHTQPTFYAQKGNCEQIHVSFPGPPNSGTALHVTRLISFLKGPSLDTVTKGLIEKYGEPGFHKSAGDNGVQHHYVWAWSVESKPLRLTEQHPCTVLEQMGLGSAGIHPAIRSNSQAKLKEGCAAVVHVHIQQDNSVVRYMTIVAMDNFGIESTLGKTSSYIDDHVANFEKKEREKAAKVVGPKL